MVPSINKIAATKQNQTMGRVNPYQSTSKQSTKLTNHREKSNLVVGKTAFLVNWEVGLLPDAADFIICEGAQAVFQVACEACSFYAEDQGRIAGREKSIAEV